MQPSRLAVGVSAQLKRLVLGYRISLAILVAAELGMLIAEPFDLEALVKPIQLYAPLPGG